MESVLILNGINKNFGNFCALKDINLEVKKGEFVCFLGPSGCGKTTLLRIISGLENQNSGEIVYENKNISKLHPSERNFGMVFQSYALFPNLTAEDNIKFGLKNRKLTKEEINEKTEEVLNTIGLYDIRKKHPGQLSGGQQQRVALARVLALSPELLLLDEPLSALDAKVRIKLRKELKNLQKNLGITTIMVTHDQEEAMTLADRIVVMNHSEIIQIGTPEEIYENPKDAFVADFIGSINFVHDDKEDKVVAIRPEHVLLENLSVGSLQKAVISDIEFRGAFYRLTLDCNENKTLLSDVPVHDYKKLQLHKFKEVNINILENKFSYYDKIDLGLV